MNFYIDTAYLVTCIHTVTRSIYDGKSSLTEQELVDKLQGIGYYKETFTSDSPEFTEFRNMLERSGYIKTDRHSWNADRVLKPFSVNGLNFKKGENFVCGSALGIRLRVSG